MIALSVFTHIFVRIGLIPEEDVRPLKALVIDPLGVETVM